VSGLPPFPLSAIVGQGALIEALLVNAVAPEVGGVLIRGERGTAKSTAVRALASLLPPVTAAIGEPFAFAPGERSPDGLVPADAAVEERPAPLVELPLGATLDRLLGALDLGRALAGTRAFEPGLLARAHGGVLYVDEVNLLPDHLVDALLDAAASRVARVERDAVSVVHDARFLLVGTMNVEEGELRPQLLDRFGLGVDVAGPRDPAVRAEIVRRRLAYERDPAGFVAGWGDEEAALAERIARARIAVRAVRLSERELLRIAGACAELGVDGVRGDIVTSQAACALAALDGAEEVDEQHVRRAAALALLHRRRHDPLDGSAPDPDDVDRALNEPPPPPPAPPHQPPGSSAVGEPPREERSERLDAPARHRFDAPVAAQLRPDLLRITGSGGGPTGRRAQASGLHAGAIDSRPAASAEADVALVASLRARIAEGPDAALREHVRGGREGVLLCLVVDASGSMGARRRLARVKGALLGILRDAYARRDRIAIVAFRDRRAELLVRPGAPLEAAAASITALPTGGRTPLEAGLSLAEVVIRRERHRDRSRRAVVVVLTDGRVSDPDGAARRRAASLGRTADAVHVVDTEEGRVRLGLAAALAAAAGARLHSLQPTRSPA
jgi:magnesium chelatase subunit D